MIHFGEAEIFEWQVTQAVNGVVWAKLAAAHLVEKLANGFRVHGEHSAVSARHPAGHV